MSKKSKKTNEEMLESALLPEEEQPHEIPENWLWSKLQFVADWGSGGTPKSTVPEYYDGNIPWLVIGDLNDDVVYNSARTITELGMKNSSAKIINEGSILIAMYGSIGKLGIAGVECTSNQAIAFTKKYYPNIHFKYLFFYLLSIRNKLISLGKGGTQQNISQTVLKEVSIPLPPIYEQRRIAEKVEGLINKIEVANQLIEEARDTYELRRAGILDKAFRGELTEKWRVNLDKIESSMEYVSSLKKITNLKGNDSKVVGDFDLPNGWCWARVGDLFHVQVGSTPSRKKEEYWGGNFPWLSSGEVQFNTINEAREGVTELAVTESRLKLAPKGSILFGMIGEGKTRGQVALLNIDAYHNQNIASIWVSETKISSLYVYFWLTSQYMKNRQNSAGNNQPAYNKSRVQELLIPVPPLAEIDIITKLLLELLEKERNIYELVSVEEKFNNIKQTIFNKAFRGELGTNKPNEESSIDLLREIVEQKL